MKTKANVSIPIGLCQCGCGEKTSIATRNSRNQGWIKGQPKRFVQGHGHRERFLPFPEAREIARKLGLRNRLEWWAWCKAKKPKNLPSHPEDTYSMEATGKWSGWNGWPDWLGYESYTILPFKEAREFARQLGLKGQEQWQSYAKSAKRPPNIPSHPDMAYPDEWNGYPDWLGYETRTILPFMEAHELARRLRLKNERAWRRYCRSGKKPLNVPSQPAITYPEEWGGWADWLGTLGFGNTWTPRAIAAYLKSIAREIPNMRDASLVKLIRQAGLDAPLAQILHAPSMQRVIELLRNDTDEIQAQLRARRGKAFDQIIRAAEPRIIEDEDFEHDEVEVDENNVHIADRLEKIVPPEFIEHLIQEKVSGLLVKYINGDNDDLRKIFSQNGGKFYREIRVRFESEIRDVSDIDTSGWKLLDKRTGEKTEPNLMQRYIAAKMKRNRSWCNWSKTGAGKTGSAGLASYVIHSQLTLVLCPNSTVDQWVEELTLTFHHCRALKSTAEVKRGKGSFLIMNYEKFQLGERSDVVVNEIVGLRPDLVVLDEVQLVKHREQGRSSIRRDAIESMLLRLPKTRVLGMTATPVINELREGVSLLEVVTGKEYNLRTRTRGEGAIEDALNLHFALMQNGLRYSPQYKQGLTIKLHPVSDDGLLPSLQSVAASTADILSIERTLLPAKLEAVRDNIKPGAIIYLEFVQGLVPVVRRFVESLGLSVGEYIGITRTMERRTFKRKFISGQVDVLIGSRAIGLGVDGLQARCNRLIILSLPWTHAAFEQLIGRVYRQGSKFAEVEVLIPQVFVSVEGERWSWDEARYSVIEHKKTLSDAAADGYVPTAENVSRTVFTQKAMDAFKLMVSRGGTKLPEDAFATAQGKN